MKLESLCVPSSASPLCPDTHFQLHLPKAGWTQPWSPYRTPKEWGWSPDSSTGAIPCTWRFLPRTAQAGVSVWSVVPTRDTHLVSIARGHITKAQTVVSRMQRGRGIHVKMLFMLSVLCASIRAKWLPVLDIQGCSFLDVAAEIRPHGSIVALLRHFSSVQSCLPFRSW